MCAYKPLIVIIVLVSTDININLKCCCCMLFNDGRVLQLWSETVAVRRRMIYDSHMITGDECDPNFLTFVLRLRENPGKISTRKLTRSGIEPGPAAWEVTMLPLDHSGGLLKCGYSTADTPQKSNMTNIPFKTVYCIRPVLSLWFDYNYTSRQCSGLYTNNMFRTASSAQGVNHTMFTNNGISVSS